MSLYTSSSSVTSDNGTQFSNSTPSHSKVSETIAVPPIVNNDYKVLWLPNQTAKNVVRGYNCASSSFPLFYFSGTQINPLAVAVKIEVSGGGFLLLDYIKDLYKAIIVPVSSVNADWPNLVTAIQMFGIRCVVTRSGKPKYLLCRHPVNRHKALSYSEENTNK